MSDRSRHGRHSGEEIIHEVNSGETIGGFKVNEKLYESAVSTIYGVTHPEYELALIMKVPKLGVILPPTTYSGFENEIHILSRLRDSYTPKFVASGEMADCPYLVMEYIEGDDLQQAINEAPLSLDKLCKLMIPACKVVHELHRHNVIHLDLKPEHLRNRDNGKVVVIDFGSAHHTYLPDMFDNAHEDAPNTLAYVAPEQLHHIRSDSRSDIYALGVIIYQLATGATPFGSSNPLTTKKRIYVPPVPPKAINQEVPDWLQEIILKCLAVNPDERFSSAKQVAYALSHPNMIELTERAYLTRRPSLWKIAKAILRSLQLDFKETTKLHPRERINKALHVLVAVDLDHTSLELQQALFTAVQKITKTDNHCYFTCLTVIEEKEPSGNEELQEFVDIEHPPHVHRQVELRHWLHPLKLPPNQINYQVFNGNAATEIIGYAKRHVVDHIVIGTRGSSTLQRIMGSVSSMVVAEAPCSVTVVRTRRDNQFG